ncbi:FG-GAP repeat domain-containing protein [Streptomyces sp. NBC_00829]|uniref:FG-GAP repeat domain-containing protein n=1 Tax=Streptomyces sp. NBC_00829 TaxID=2903679 RepID=UPI003863024E|nr:VCBS repeat-containing protein [Streptomyces sp. NBC_00829]
MANLPGRKRGRGMSRLAVAAIAAALVGTSAGAAVADTPVPAPLKSADIAAAAVAEPSNAPAAAQAGSTPVFLLWGVDKNTNGYVYGPSGTGGFATRSFVDSGWNGIKLAAAIDLNADGESDGAWTWDTSGHVAFADDTQSKLVGSGWNIYNTVLTPSNLGGTSTDDVLARDSAGVLWLYKGNSNGTLTARVKVGSGWNIYTHITGKGDLSGDGRADLVVKDSAGVLWLYKGTGNATAPFSARTKVGSGWNIYNKIIANGDLNLDGRADVVARDAAGVLWLYKGTGNAAAPFSARTKVGSGFNIYNKLF